MAEEATTTETTEATTTEETTSTEDQRVPYERFQQANKKAKEAADQAKGLQKQLDDLKAQMDEREQAGLPELDRIKKAAEQAEKRAAEAEKRAETAEAERERTRKERWVTAAAKDFADPDDATRFVDLDGIDDEKDAERAVKTVAKAKPHLLKAEEPKLPGRVLENGRTATGQDKKTGGIDLDAEAQMVSDELKKFLANRS